MLFRKIITVYSEDHKEPIHTLCERNAELMNIKVGGRLSYRVTERAN
jgi:hypothetical protein